MRAANRQLPSVPAIQPLTAVKYSGALSAWFRSCGAPGRTNASTDGTWGPPRAPRGTSGVIKLPGLCQGAVFVRELGEQRAG